MLNILARLGKYPLRILLLLCVTLGLSAVLYIAQAPAARPVFSTANLPPLAVGDWVFRAGTSAESHLIQTLSDSEFSHIGMVVSLQPEPLIAHATTDDDQQRLNQVLTSTLSDFIDPQLARSFAIARPLFVTKEENKKTAARVLQQLQQPFVLAERSTEHLYCTTLLADALNNTARPFQPKWQQVNAPLLSGEYLFPRAFADYPGVEWVYRSADIEH